MPRTITETTTLAELEVVLRAFGLTMTAWPDGGRWLVGVTGEDLKGISRIESAYGATIAEAAQSALEKWCTKTGNALAAASHEFKHHPRDHRRGELDSRCVTCGERKAVHK